MQTACCLSKDREVNNYKLWKPISSRKELVWKNKNEKTVSINLENKDLSILIKEISKQTKLNILLSPNVTETNVSISVKNKNWIKVLDETLDNYDLALIRLDENIYLVNVNNKIQVSKDKLDARNIIIYIAANYNKTVILDKSIKGKYFMDIDNMHWIDAILYITRLCGPDYNVYISTIDSSVILITKKNINN